MKLLISLVKDYPNGFIIRTIDGTFIKSGWVVVMRETQTCFGKTGLKLAFDVAKKTSNVIGCWKQGKNLYWDAVIVFDNEEDAVSAATENEQIAIYNIENNQTKYLS